MAIGTTYFAGNEITGFTVTGSASVNVSNTQFRPAWSRCALEIPPAAAADPPTNYFSPLQNFSTVSALWAHGQFAWSALGGSADLNATMVELIDAGGTARLLVRGAGSGAVKFTKRSAAGALTDLITSAANVMPLGGLTPYSFDWNVNYGAVVTSGARTDISFAGSTVSTVAGNFLADGFTPGGTIVVSGSSNDNGTYTLATVTEYTMTITGTFPGEAAGSSITIESTGTTTLYLAGNKVLYFAGGISTDSVTTLAQIAYANCNVSNGIYWSEELVSDTITINAGIFTLPPVAAGVDQAWAGVVGDIDGITINDTLFISDGTAGDLSGWTTPGTLPVGAWAIQSIVQEARAAVGGTGPQHFDWYCRTTDGTNHAGGADNAPIETFMNFGNFIWAENPATAEPWAVTDIGAGFNLGLKSLS